MNITPQNLFRTLVVGVLGVHLFGCEASDLAYFNLGAQCYANYPNDSWAQQQCVDIGSAEIQYYENEQYCDDAVYEIGRQRELYDSSTRELDEWLKITHTQVVDFPYALDECLSAFTFEQCSRAFNEPVLSNISEALFTLNELSMYEGNIKHNRQQVISQCSAFYTFGNAQYNSSDYYTSNRNVLSGWQQYVQNTSAELRRVYRK
ncbi:hypothetical protein CWE13_08635 [Aliidiomarina shirensis]|uniref:Uncharacterized protein n=1 Tax=Aliidiomarina shirensis TaxID=1048642 RepID=A0A432WT07_9GAMM|nr:hypothetical protein [Aliidiomarina shirensis]RUO36903.1 hypothetical protein CWE13_08635 [Aliidiomarina shirensis]